MSAGSGVYHSEFNASEREAVHLLQIWILPEQKGIDPSYQEKHFPLAQRRGRLCLVASRDGRDGSITVNQDVSLYATLLGESESAAHPLAAKRHAWIHVARGAVKVNGQLLRTGSGAAASDESSITLEAIDASEVLLFDLA
jgi:redox-sensitive bicupin YhaK (pirin superfamily)